MTYVWQVTTPPAEEPVTLTEAKLQVQIDSDITIHDPYITILITAARQMIEAETDRSIVTQTITTKIHAFPHTGHNTWISLPRPNLQSITSISYVDCDGVTQVWDSSLYEIETFREPGIVYPAFGECYPTTRSQPYAVTIVHPSGYGNASEVPDTIKQAMFLLISHGFNNRSAVCEGSFVELPRGFDSLIAQIKIHFRRVF